MICEMLPIMWTVFFFHPLSLKTNETKEKINRLENQKFFWYKYKDTMWQLSVNRIEKNYVS